MAKERVMIFDTTLRDGEQAPGFSMDPRQKLMMARQLARLGVDVIEAGFPASSKTDFLAVEAIAREIRGVEIAGLCRASQPDIECCFEAIKKADQPRIHTFIATSDLHIKEKLKSTRKKVLEQIKKSVRLARRLCSNVEFSAEDATRTERDYLACVIGAAIEAGAGIINIPDTVGYAIPEEYANLIRFLYGQVPALKEVVLSTHCHDDLGLAVANSLTALQFGARQVECSINGIGERAGNCALEEIVMAIGTRQNILELKTKIRTEEIVPTSRLLTNITGVKVQPNKAIVGANAFAHEAGIHVAGVIKKASTYEIMTPRSVGWKSNRIVLARHSGTAGLGKITRDLGYSLRRDELKRVMERVKELSLQKDIYNTDVEAIIAEEILKISARIRFIQATVVCGNGTVPTATIDLEIEKNIKRGVGMGNGPVDATFTAIKKMTGYTKVRLVRFSLDAISGRSDAQARAHVVVRSRGFTVSAFGLDNDIVVASAKAFVSTLNKLEQISVANGHKKEDRR